MSPPPATEAQSANEATPVVNRKPNRISEAVAFISVLKYRTRITNIRDAGAGWQGWEITWGFNHGKVLSRRNRFRKRFGLDRLMDADQFTGSIVEDDFADIEHIIVGIDQTVQPQALGDFSFQRSNPPRLASPM